MSSINDIYSAVVIKPFHTTVAGPAVLAILVNLHEKNTHN